MPNPPRQNDVLCRPALPDLDVEELKASNLRRKETAQRRQPSQASRCLETQCFNESSDSNVCSKREFSSHLLICLLSESDHCYSSLLACLDVASNLSPVMFCANLEKPDPLSPAWQRVLICVCVAQGRVGPTRQS